MYVFTERKIENFLIMHSAQVLVFSSFLFSFFLVTRSLARRPFNPAYTHKITSRVCYDCFQCTHSEKITSEQNITFTEMKVEGGGSRQGMETEHFLKTLNLRIFPPLELKFTHQDNHPCVGRKIRNRARFQKNLHL